MFTALSSGRRYWFVRNWKMVLVPDEAERITGVSEETLIQTYLLLMLMVKPLPLFLRVMGIGVSESETTVPATLRYFFAPRL